MLSLTLPGATPRRTSHSTQPKSSRHLTTRWNGPGILRRRQEIIEIGVPVMHPDEAIPGRSARTRLLAYPIYLRSQILIT